jgi:hypothetical protein
MAWMAPLGCGCLQSQHNSIGGFRTRSRVSVRAVKILGRILGGLPTGYQRESHW